MIQNILDVLTFKSWKGNRTKILIVLIGIGMGLNHVGVIPDAIWNQVTMYSKIVGTYFGIEHLDSYFKKA